MARERRKRRSNMSELPSGALRKTQGDRRELCSVSYFLSIRYLGEEISEGKWVANQMLKDGEAKIRIFEVAEKFIDKLPNEERTALGKHIANRACIEISEIPSTVVYRRNHRKRPGLLHPGSVGEYVTARKIFYAIEAIYCNRGWDTAVPQDMLDQSTQWEETKTTSVQNIYRRVGLQCMVKRVQ